MPAGLGSPATSEPGCADHACSRGARARLAARTDSVELHAMFLEAIPDQSLHAPVQGLLVRHRQVFERAAFHAADVVVPLATGLVSRRFVANLAFEEQAFLNEELQVAVHRAEADRWQLPARPLEHRLRRGMVVRCHENLVYHLALKTRPPRLSAVDHGRYRIAT